MSAELEVLSISSFVRLPDDIPVSIVIPTRDRPAELFACLSSLVEQDTKRSVEIIVADNNPNSGLTADIVAQFSQVKLLREYRKGASYARNTGIGASSGDIIVMIDDDMTAPKDWLESLIAPFNRPEVAGVTGNVLPLELETESQKLFQSYGIGGLTRGNESWDADASWFAAHKTRAVRTWMLGCSGNAAFRAEIFADKHIGLVEELLGPGSGAGCAEDMHFFYKILRAHRIITFNPDAFTWHSHRRTMADLTHQLFDYSKGSVGYQLLTFLRYGDFRSLAELLIWIPAWSAYRVYERLIGRSDYPVYLVLWELWGNLVSPVQLFKSYLRVKRLGRSTPYVPVSLRKTIGASQFEQVS